MPAKKIAEKKEKEIVKAAEAETEVKTEAPKKRGRKPASAASGTTAAAAAKTPAKRKTTAKKAEKKLFTKLQFGDREYDTDDIMAACKADYKAKTNGHVRSMTVYIKPEEFTAYYVVNDKYSDKIEL